MRYFDDIVFARRNREYGAFDLRSHYARNTVIGFIVALVIVGGLAGGEYLLYLRSELSSPPVPDFTTDVYSLVDLSKIEIPEIERIEELPEEPSNTAPIVVDSLVDYKQKDTPNQQPLSAKDTLKQKLAEQRKADSLNKADEDNEPVYTHTDEMPEFMNGADDLRRFIAKHTVYPDSAVMRNQQGVVYIQLLVKSSGKVGQVTLKKSAAPLLDREALRVANLLSKWKPGKHGGKAVNVLYTIPFNFRL